MVPTEYRPDRTWSQCPHGRSCVLRVARTCFFNFNCFSIFCFFLLLSRPHLNRDRLRNVLIFFENKMNKKMQIQKQFFVNFFFGFGIFGLFWPLFPQKRGNQNLSAKFDSITFQPFDPLTSCKCLEPIPRKIGYWRTQRIYLPSLTFDYFKTTMIQKTLFAKFLKM